MAYAFEIGVHMSPTMNQVKVLLQAAEGMKDKIIGIWADEAIPYAVKTRKIEGLRDALRATERSALGLMREELLGREDGNGEDGV